MSKIGYKSQITKALKLSNWDEIIRLADEARRNTEKSIFDFRKGVFNIIEIYSSKDLDMFRNALNGCREFKIFTIKGAIDLRKEIKNGNISKETLKDSYVIIFTYKKTVIKNILKLGCAINRYYFYSGFGKSNSFLRNVHDRKFYLIDESEIIQFKRTLSLEFLLM